MKRVIAVVEDNPDNRLLLGAMLSDRYTLVEYENGPDAIEGIRREPPALILLDISLPGMDGVEVFSRLRADEDTSAIPIIALTAHAMGGDREMFTAMGFDEYVSKPIVDESILTAAIERHVPRLMLV